MHNNWKDQLNFLLYNKPSLTIIPICSLTLLPGPIQKTHFSLTFETISVYLACKTSRISTWFIVNYAKFTHFTKLPKVPTISKLFSNGTICFVLSFRISNSCGPVTRCQKWMLPCQNTLYDVYFIRTPNHPGLLLTSARH